jgi:uncharacterized membrane protein
MATERTTERDDGVVTERIIERGADGGGPTVIKAGGGGMGFFLGLMALAIVALIAVFLVVESNRNSRDAQVADAASSVASSASRAADSVGDAAASAGQAASDAGRAATDAVDNAGRQ